MNNEAIIGFFLVLVVAAALIACGWGIGETRAKTAFIAAPTMSVTTTAGVTTVTVNGRVVTKQDAERLVAFWKKVAEEASKEGTDGH